MYVIAGATGRVGSAAARQLLAAGARVRVLVRRDVDAEYWAALGAESRLVALEDQSALAEALDGCVGFFTLLPFDLTVDDLDAHARTLIDSIAGAVAGQHVPHVVMLSSGGADLPDGTGPIAGLHQLEQALRATGTTLTALRPVHFQEKIADVVGIARDSGVYPVFAASAEVPYATVATQDIGAIVAQELLSPARVSESVDVIGPVYSDRAIAGLLGAALGQELHVATLPESTWLDTLVDAGFRPHIAASLAELYRADQQGRLDPRGDRRVQAHTDIETTIGQVLAS